MQNNNKHTHTKYKTENQHYSEEGFIGLTKLSKGRIAQKWFKIPGIIKSSYNTIAKRLKATYTPNNRRLVKLIMTYIYSRILCSH